jgi:hypothetical protein
MPMVSSAISAVVREVSVVEHLSDDERHDGRCLVRFEDYLHYLPLNFGVLFSRKARTPSALSAVVWRMTVRSVS